VAKQLLYFVLSHGHTSLSSSLAMCLSLSQNAYSAYVTLYKQEAALRGEREKKRKKGSLKEMIENMTDSEEEVEGEGNEEREGERIEEEGEEESIVEEKRESLCESEYRTDHLELYSSTKSCLFVLSSVLNWVHSLLKEYVKDKVWIAIHTDNVI
jgi:hypothetical protein